MLKNNPKVQRLGIDFQNEVEVQDAISKGHSLTAALYNKGVVPNECLDEHRFHLFEKMARKKKKCVQLESLPPTMSANEQHCRRVYQQICCWKGRYPFLMKNK